VTYEGTRLNTVLTRLPSGKCVVRIRVAVSVQLGPMIVSLAHRWLDETV
jgi:hypothetical protein